MHINNASLKERDKNIYHLQLLSVSLKIKFPCKMFVTHQTLAVTSEVDPQTSLTTLHPQDKNFFIFESSFPITIAS